jgi:hypothetical protein
MAETERVINDLNVVKITLCNPQMLLTPEMRVRIGQVVTSAIDLLKDQEPKPVKVVKNAYNHEFYYCPRCDRSFYELSFGKPKFCDKCGQEVKWE